MHLQARLQCFVFEDLYLKGDVMGLFGKAKHGLIDVIRYDGDPGVLVWKHDCEDFNNNCQLIVQEGQEAIFVKNGQALESFLPGRYTLSSQNYPFVRSLVGAVTNGGNPFQCAVYYINKAISMGVEWGTDSPIMMQDPVYRLPIGITAYGDFSIAVVDSKMLLTTLVSTTKGFSHDEIQQCFGSLMATKIRSVISLSMISKGLSPLGIDAYLDDLSREIKPKLDEVFSQYGIGLRHFTIAHIGYTGLEEVEATLGKEMVSDISFSREAERTRLKTNVEVESKRKHGKADNDLFLEKGKYEAEVNEAQGISELQRQMLGVAAKQADNPGPILGGSAFGLGLGNGDFSMGGYGSGLKTTGANATESLRVIADLGSGTSKGKKSSEPVDLAMPFGMAGVMDEASSDDFDAKVEKLLKLKDSGLISDEEFKRFKKQLLESIMKGD